MAVHINIKRSGQNSWLKIKKEKEKGSWLEIEKRERLNLWDIALEEVNPYDVTGKMKLKEIPGVYELVNELSYSPYIPINFKNNGDVRSLLDFRGLYSYAIPSEEALNEICKYSPICEVGAGTGYWAKLLSERGADITAWDIDPPNFKENAYCMTTSCYFPVKKCEPSFVPPANKSLFLCWPPYDEPMANDMLSRYNGDILIYIGESDGGCTGDSNFFKTLRTSWNCIKEIRIPQHSGIRDYLAIFNRTYN